MGRKANEPADFILGVKPVQVVDEMSKCWEWQGSLSSRGYGQIGIKGRTFRVHRVAYAYSKARNLDSLKGVVIRHMCDNPLCCRPSHLLEGTQKDNKQDSVSRGRHCFGVRSHFSKLCEGDVKFILKSNETGPELAKKFGVTKATIHRIRIGKSWKHIKDEQAPEYKGRYGLGVGVSKLCEDNVRYILKSDKTGPELARKFGVTKQTIYDIRKGKIWKHVKP